MKFVAYLVGILSIPIYYVVLAYLFAGLVLALVQLSACFGVMGIWLVLPVSVALSLWFGHLTTRFLLRRWSREANALEGQG
jgi:hypothetical protein